MNEKAEKPWHKPVMLIVVGALFVFMVLHTFDTPVPGEIIEAKIVGVKPGPKNRPTPKLVVELSNGATVVLGQSEGVLRQIGATVRVQKMERKILGSTHFRFVEAADK